MEFYDYDVTKCAVILRSSLAVVLSDPMVNNYNLFAQKGKSSAFTGYLAGNSRGVAYCLVCQGWVAYLLAFYLLVSMHCIEICVINEIQKSFNFFNKKTWKFHIQNLLINCFYKI